MPSRELVHGVMILIAGILLLTPGFITDAMGFALFVPQLRDALMAATGERWQLEEVAEGGAPTLVEAQEANQQAAHDQMLEHPLVKATFEAFPDAEFDEETQAAAGAGRKWG